MEQISPFISEFKVGIAAGLKDFTFEYGQYFLSPEFQGGLHHKWGSFTVRVAL